MAATAAPRLRVLISGATGMLGRALESHLSIPCAANAFNPQVFRLVRDKPAFERDVWWDPRGGRIDVAALEGFDAVIHLAGENVGSGDGLLAFTGRWSDAKKHRIMESRRRGTSLLAGALASLRSKPKVLISASGVGYYGDCGDAEVTEATGKGGLFLSDVAAEWEASTAPAAKAGIRVVNTRFGAILSPTGGVIGESNHGGARVIQILTRGG